MEFDDFLAIFMGLGYFMEFRLCLGEDNCLALWFFVD